jgi:peroxiredoxin
MPTGGEVCSVREVPRDGPLVVKRMAWISLIPALWLLTGVSPVGAMTFPTGEPELLDDDTGYLDLAPEAEFRKRAEGAGGGEEAVPLKAGPTGLSPRALFDSILLDDREVALAVDGGMGAGYRVVADLNADGDLRDDPVWPMKRRKVEVPDSTGAPVMKEAWVAETEQRVAGSGAGKGSTAWIRFRVTLTEGTGAIPGDPRPGPQALFAQSTLRKGTVRIDGRTIPFAIRGVGGVYDYDFDAVLFDLDGDGKLDSTRRTSAEYFWVWEREVRLAGRSYEFAVDRYGRSLSLTPVSRALPDRPGLEVGQRAPDFSFVDFDGRRRRLSDFRGQIVLVDFWGTWCPGCVAHVGELAEAYRRLHGKGFEILGIHSGGKEDEVRRFAAGHGMTWPQTIETGEAIRERPLQRLYRFLGAPNYFLLDRDGIILTNDVRKPALLIREVERALAAAPGIPPKPSLR